MHVGEAYLDLTPGALHHLWLVLTGVDHDGEVAVASITTRYPHTRDLTCILQAGDHPFVVHESVIFYQKARMVSVANFTGWRNRGIVRPKEPASDELMDRIRQGALTSPFTPNSVKRAVRDCPWLPDCGHAR